MIGAATIRRADAPRNMATYVVIHATSTHEVTIMGLPVFFSVVVALRLILVVPLYMYCLLSNYTVMKFPICEPLNLESSQRSIELNIF